MIHAILGHIPQIRIFQVRNKQVVPEADLAEIYGVPTKVFNQAVKRILERFPDEFSFVIDSEELETLISQNVPSNKTREGRRYNVHAFAEHSMMTSTIAQERARSSHAYLPHPSLCGDARAPHGQLGNIKTPDRGGKKLLEQDNALWDIYQKRLPLLQPDEPEARAKCLGFVTN